MNKLYKIMVTHYAPKDYYTSIKEYVVASNDREVFEYLAKGYAYWEDILEDYDSIGIEECREIYEEIYSNKGDDREVYDLYYGATQYSWEEVPMSEYRNEKDINTMLYTMIQLGLAKKINISKEIIGRDTKSLEVVLENLGVKLKDSNGKFRNFSDVLHDVSILFEEDNKNN